MDYSSLVIAIKKYLKRLYHYRISFDLKFGKPLTATRADIKERVLSSLSEEILEALLQQMYEDGYVVKDDGQSLQFSTGFVFD